MKLSFQADRDPAQNSRMFEDTRKVMVGSAISEQIILDDDLAMVPEVMPYLFRLAGQLRDDFYKFHTVTKQQLQPPLMQNCFCYCFSKGAESAFHWNETDDGKIQFAYDPVSAIKGNFTPPDEVDEDFVFAIGGGIEGIANVFCDFQDKILMSPANQTTRDGRWFADFVACGFYWASAIGLDFGMNRLGLSPEPETASEYQGNVHDTLAKAGIHIDSPNRRGAKINKPPSGDVSKLVMDMEKRLEILRKYR